MTATLAFVGGGNMASAIIGGLLRAGRDAAAIVVVDPNAAQRERLGSDFGVATLPAADASLADAETLVWAVKPQFFAAAAAACAGRVGHALHLSVMAGVRSDAIAAAVGGARVVRAMPNTPALIGQGIAGLFARDAVSAADRAEVEAILAPTGETLWVDAEAALDAVTALSGSGPAYVFYLLEALLDAGSRMGLPDDTARRLALATLAGATRLARDASEPPAVLRQRVTSPGGTTEAAIATLDAAGTRRAIVDAVEAAWRRARELGDALGP